MTETKTGSEASGGATNRKPRSRRQRVRDIFLDAVAALAWSDGQVDPSELQSIDQGLQRIGLLRRSETFEEHVVGRTIDLDTVPVEDLAFPWECESLLTVMWSVAMADGTYMACEKTLIEQLAARMGVEPERVKELQDIVCGDAVVQGEDGQDVSAPCEPEADEHEHEDEPFLMASHGVVSGSPETSRPERHGGGHSRGGRDDSLGGLVKRFFRRLPTSAP